MSNREAGKGCKPRPFSVTQDEYDQRWNAIFQRDLPKEEDKEVKTEEDKNTTQD